jgi:hypothetical protein
VSPTNVSVLVNGRSNCAAKKTEKGPPRLSASAPEPSSRSGPTTLTVEGCVPVLASPARQEGGRDAGGKLDRSSAPRVVAAMSTSTPLPKVTP